uniref:G_PROTEIN_RECEP_F1_2 domain-containing protein n=1 Tax=Ascaris lumbricoides TaxID=6252 RepID=A0A0M3IAD5_ASCLU
MDKLEVTVQTTMASLILIIVPFFLCLYVVVINQLRIKNAFRTITAYKIMIAIGLFDCIQLCVHLCSAVVEVIYLCGVYDAVTIKSSIPIKILGAFLSAAWYPMILARLTLALDQLLTIVFPNVKESAFSLANVQVLQLTPLVNYEYHPKLLVWSFDQQSRLGFTLERIDTVLSAIFVVSSLHFYLIIIVSTIKKVLLLNGFQVLVVVYWSMTSLFGSFEDVVENMISNLMWVTWNFINPVIYISFNRALRKHVVDYYRDMLRKQPFSLSSGKLGHSGTDVLPPKQWDVKDTVGSECFVPLFWRLWHFHADNPPLC